MSSASSPKNTASPDEGLQVLDEVIAADVGLQAAAQETGVRGELAAERAVDRATAATRMSRCRRMSRRAVPPVGMLAAGRRPGPTAACHDRQISAKAPARPRAVAWRTVIRAAQPPTPSPPSTGGTARAAAPHLHRPVRGCRRPVRTMPRLPPWACDDPGHAGAAAVPRRAAPCGTDQSDHRSVRRRRRERGRPGLTTGQLHGAAPRAATGPRVAPNGRGAFAARAAAPAARPGPDAAG